MVTVAYIHLPGISLMDGPHPVNGGDLAVPAFEEWFPMERRFRHAESAYARSQPVFWRGAIPLSERPEPAEIESVVSYIRFMLHLALMLQNGEPLLPTPVLSATYVRLTEEMNDGRAGWRRMIGPFECEWIVFGSPILFPMDAAAAKSADILVRKLDSYAEDAWLPEIRAAAAALEQTARPDCWWGGDEQAHRVSGFVQSLAACEGLLLPEDLQGEKITDAFGRCAAILCPGENATHETTAARCSDLYRLRSKFIHGQIGMAELDAVQLANLAEGRKLLCSVILHALAVAGTLPKGTSIADWIAKQGLS